MFPFLGRGVAWITGFRAMASLHVHEVDVGSLNYGHYAA